MGKRRAGAASSFDLDGELEAARARLAELPAAKREEIVRAMPANSVRRLRDHFPAWAHEGQLPPAGDAWRTWVIMGGRGFGKTRAGAEWVLSQVRGAADPAGFRMALVAATVDEARGVMVEGTSGLMALAREGEVERFLPAERRLLFANGAEAVLFSGHSPARLRGPEHDLAWCDELAKWRHAGETWDMLQLGLRRGERPRAVVTTTPSADPALRRVLADPDMVRTGGASHANRHLPGAFLRAIEAAYGGTRLGRQEIEGLLCADREGSLWPAELVEQCRGGRPADGELVRVVVGVDPPATTAGTCGIVVAATARDGRAWVLADLSVEGRSPQGWADAVAAAWRDWEADRVVAEVNQGGDMVADVLRGAAAAVPLELVRASRGKATRAEPVAALFEGGRAGFAGSFPKLEAELAEFTAGGWLGRGSPDRADAMVWALWALCIRERGDPGVRRV